MANVPNSSLKTWNDGDTFHATDYSQDRSILQAGINDNYSKINLNNAALNLALSLQQLKTNDLSDDGSNYTGKWYNMLPSQISSSTFNLFEKKWTATEGQTVFQLTGSDTLYTPNSKTTWVMVGGVPQTVGEGYTETDNKTITLAEGVSAGIEVEMRYFLNNASTETPITNMVGFQENVAVPLADIAIDVKSPTYGAKGDGVTDDTQAIISAVNDAYTQNRPLNWPNATYLTTANIPYLHNVTHIGKGMIKRGSNLFYVNPSSNNANTLYATATGGSSLNDGLDVNSPFDSIQTFFNILPNYGSILNGGWALQLSDGNFSGGALLQNMRSYKSINIYGTPTSGYPAVPTTFITQGSNVSGWGLQGQYNVNLYVKDIKVVGFNADSSSGGIAVSYNSQLKTSNVHTDSCYFGLSGMWHHEITIPDGLHTNNGYVYGQSSGSGGAIRSQMDGVHYIGSQTATSVTKQAIFQNCASGVQVAEMSTGHVNWVTIKGCTDGVLLSNSGHVNGDGILFQQNNRDVRVSTGATFLDTANTVYSTGANQSTQTIIQLTGASLASANLFSTYTTTYAMEKKILSMKYLNQVIQTTGYTTLWSTALKANHWRTNVDSITQGKLMDFVVTGRIAGINGTKTLVLRLTDLVTSISTPISVAFQSTETGEFTVKGRVLFYGQATQYMQIEGDINGGTRKNSSLTATFPMTNDTNFILQAYVANAADSITVEYIEVNYAG